MRGSGRFIQTESFGLSIGVGTLLPLLLLLLGFDMPGEILFYSALILPFLCGFSASVVFGTESPGGIGYNVLAGLIAFVILYSVLVVSIVCGGPRTMNTAIYLSLVFFPLSFIAQIVLAILGAVLGRKLAGALER